MTYNVLSGTLSLYTTTTTSTISLISKKTDQIFEKKNLSQTYMYLWTKTSPLGYISELSRTERRPKFRLKDNTAEQVIHSTT